MTASQIRLLTLAPYRILPANTGGRQSIAFMHDALGSQCRNHVAGTADNAAADAYAFTLHRIFPAKPLRYLPYYKLGELVALGRKLEITHVFCEHPYMAPTAEALSRKLGVPWFLRSQNIESTRFRDLGKFWWPALFSFEKWAMKKADGVFFITPEDRNWAIGHYGVRPSNSHMVPYGTSFSSAPGRRPESRAALAASLGIDPGVPWLYFLGVLSYPPNAEAVRLILTEVLPRLLQQGLKCQVLIGGKGLPEDIQAMIREAGDVVRYTGFVDDLDVFIRSCDVMLNAVVSGGGIKTKAVEALGYNKTVVSTRSAAAGIVPEVCGDKLLLSDDTDWDTFAAHCIAATGQQAVIPDAFYRQYYWGSIAHQVLDVMTAVKN